MKTLSKSLVLLLGILTVVFIGHYYIQTMWEAAAFETLSLTYSVNFFLTILIIMALAYMAKRSGKQLGFAFLFSSFLKFAVFFIAVRPFLEMSGSVKSSAFAAFFVPYAICLIFEVMVLLKLLKEQE